MERPDFFTLKNGEKVKLPFSNSEYNERVNKLTTAMDSAEKDNLVSDVNELWSKLKADLKDQVKDNKSEISPSRPTGRTKKLESWEVACELK